VPTVTKSEYDTLWGKMKTREKLLTIGEPNSYAHSLYNRMNEVPEERYTLEGWA
jgi:hypothetical protein